MTLPEIAERGPNLRLHFIPKYGWGWKAPSDNPSLSYGDIERDGAVELQVVSAFQWRGNFRGLYGVISASAGILGGYNFVLWSMGEGVIDPETPAENHRWDLYFSRQPFRDDHVDFPDQEEAGVGYGTPTLTLR